MKRGRPERNYDAERTTAESLYRAVATVTDEDEEEFDIEEYFVTLTYNRPPGRRMTHEEPE